METTPEDPRFDALAKAYARRPGVTVGRMMASVGLKVDGRIFAMLVRGKLVVKLPRERVDALVAARQGVRFDPRHDGRVMKEWALLEGDAPPWPDLAEEAFRFVSAEKPPPRRPSSRKDASPGRKPARTPRGRAAR